MKCAPMTTSAMKPSRKVNRPRQESPQRSLRTKKPANARADSVDFAIATQFLQAVLFVIARTLLLDEVLTILFNLRGQTDFPFRATFRAPRVHRRDDMPSRELRLRDQQPCARKANRLLLPLVRQGGGRAAVASRCDEIIGTQPPTLLAMMFHHGDWRATEAKPRRFGLA